MRRRGRRSFGAREKFDEKDVYGPSQIKYWVWKERNWRKKSHVMSGRRRHKSKLQQHSVEIAEILDNSHFFRKNFVKAMVLLKKLLNSWFDEFFFSEREFRVFPHCVPRALVCVYKKKQKDDHAQKISWDQFYRKLVVFTKIFQNTHNIVKIMESQYGKTRNALSLKKISSNQLFSNFFSKTIAFTKFLRKKCEREFLQFPHCDHNIVHTVENTEFCC